MGDAGFLRRVNVQVRRHNLMGELVICKGSVFVVDHDSGVVSIELLGENQDGHESARGTAEVVLPKRADSRAAP
jgi:hypothetical protein